MVLANRVLLMKRGLGSMSLILEMPFPYAVSLYLYVCVCVCIVQCVRMVCEVQVGWVAYVVCASCVMCVAMIWCAVSVVRI